ncbi:MAG: hypothetical protein JWO98_172 [Frankiales bacterium]|nr:hypothetical protein [Frankiales bacterium]
MSIRTVLGALLCALLVGGCSSHAATSAGGNSGSTAAAVAASSSAEAARCGVYRAGSNVRVLLTPTSDAGCSALAKQLSSDGSFWTVRSQPDDQGQLLVCAMKRTGYSADVEDTGAQIFGQQLCSWFLSQGWTEDTATENHLANAAAAASASAATAAAAAAASQEAADQLSRDQNAAAQLVSSLRGVPGQLTSDIQTMDGHLRQAVDDLAKTRGDAANGQGDNCYNVSTVQYDATSKVGYDATNDVGYDATNDVGYNINEARTNLTSLRQSLQQIAAENGAAPADASAVIGNATNAIATAITQANNDIDKANTAATAAYNVAAGMATGSCSGYGPGTFQPVQHIQ